MKTATPPPVLYHGTGEKFLASIRKQGLLPKSGLYVHLSDDSETAKTVGKRHGRPVIFCIDARKMVEDGYTFYLSANGVWLTEKVPIQYLVEGYFWLKTWTNVTREDVMREVAPGVLEKDQQKINQLNWSSWLMHMGDLLDMDVHSYALTTREHFDTVLFIDYGEYIRATEDHYPPYEEMDAYMKTPEVQQTLDYLTQTTIRLTKENWPEFRDRICAETGLDPKLFRFPFEIA